MLKIMLLSFHQQNLALNPFFSFSQTPSRLQFFAASCRHRLLTLPSTLGTSPQSNLKSHLRYAQRYATLRQQ